MAASSSRPLAAPTGIEDPRYSLPPFPSNPGDAELLRHLSLLLALYSSSSYPFSRIGVNAGLPWLDPWDLPGMRREEEAKAREKYFVTDYSALKSTSTVPATQSGFWKPRDLGWGIPGEGIGPVRFAGLKTTYDFHIGHTIYQEGNKRTNWIMDVYFLIDQKNGQVEDDLVMCHVFESNSRDYDPRPRCTAHHDESPKEKGSLISYHYQEQCLNQCDKHSAEEDSNQDVCGQTNNALVERSAGLLPTHISCDKPLTPPYHAPEPGCVSHHHASKENGETSHEAIHGQSNNSFQLTESDFPPLSPLSMAFLGNLENIMETSGAETSMEIENYKPNEGVSSTVSASAENGPLGKRTRTKNKTKSAVWVRFTKLLTKAKAVLAICNHCCKVMTGDSSNGTSHLKRHKCHCNHHLVATRQHGAL